MRTKIEVTAIPGSRLRAASRSEQMIEDEALPVNVRVLAFYDNSTLKDVTPDNLATTGVGLETRAVEVSKSGGTDNQINLASAYVELLGQILRRFARQISDQPAAFRSRDVVTRSASRRTFMIQ